MTQTPIHPARQMPFDVLVAGLDDAVAKGMVKRRDSAELGVSMYTYTERCVYEGAWDAFSLVARGLIIDHVNGRLVATPFPKFFNVGELLAVIPDLPFEAFEKLDGSLIIAFHHAGEWRTATKGSFDSDQAKWAKARLDDSFHDHMDEGSTYLFEAVYPENRIVVHYAEPALVLLGAYWSDGEEHDPIDLGLLVALNGDGWRRPQVTHFEDLGELVELAKGLPSSLEGYVLRFADGSRVKVKGDEYKRIHALMSNAGPLQVWASLLAGDDMQALRRDLPEEFWEDFDQIHNILMARFLALFQKLVAKSKEVDVFNDKELGLRLTEIDEDVRPFMFPFRKSGHILHPRLKETMWRAIRPTGGVLDGYTPSYAVSAVQSELAA